MELDIKILRLNINKNDYLQIVHGPLPCMNDNLYLTDVINILEFLFFKKNIIHQKQLLFI